MAYILRSARWIASDVLHQVIEEGDTEYARRLMGEA